MRKREWLPQRSPRETAIGPALELRAERSLGHTAQADVVDRRRSVALLTSLELPDAAHNAGSDSMSVPGR
jgi:hypothetical protein